MRVRYLLSGVERLPKGRKEVTEDECQLCVQLCVHLETVELLSATVESATVELLGVGGL